jgi:hypothetical protein
MMIAKLAAFRVAPGFRKQAQRVGFEDAITMGDRCDGRPSK